MLPLNVGQIQLLVPEDFWAFLVEQGAPDPGGKHQDFEKLWPNGVRQWVCPMATALNFYYSAGGAKENASLRLLASPIRRWRLCDIWRVQFITSWWTKEARAFTPRRSSRWKGGSQGSRALPGPSVMGSWSHWFRKCLAYLAT